MCAGTESSGVWITAWWIICPCVFSVSGVNETHNGTWQQALNPTLSDGCVCSLRSPSLVRGEPRVLRLLQLSGKTRRTLAVSSVHRGVTALWLFHLQNHIFLCPLYPLPSLGVCCEVVNLSHRCPAVIRVLPPPQTHLWDLIVLSPKASVLHTVYKSNAGRACCAVMLYYYGTFLQRVPLIQLQI